ncbi:cytochrome P450 [Aspergillus coremiiformis]|uniref:Cytochrome P450 n=1 Tax=Aspergillus coremiiformis TaxID=138285 RepID=A0A5N6ZB93_9EURO|nr:cytochrome P450 [Aspergillus coremiiformis]
MTVTMHSLSGIILAVAGFLGLYVLMKSRTSKALPLPPGPKGLPMIGSVGSDLPPRGGKDWEHWWKHKELYGPISSVTTAGYTLIILNDTKVALELLEKRSARYSSRPRMVMARELAGAGLFMTLRNDPITVRAQRKRVHLQLCSELALSSLYPQMDLEVRRFLLRTLRKPEGLMGHIQTTIGGIILKITYGYTTEPHGRDPLLDLVAKTAVGFGKVNQPAAWLVDSIPALKYLPTWFPGAEFKKEAREYRAHFNTLANWPFAFVQHQMNAGKFEPSFVSTQIQQAGPHLSLEEEWEIKSSAAAVYQAGYDTTVSTIKLFFLTMALFPRAQRKAQEEIDRVVGTRLPTPDDQANLPYVNALINEVLRWDPVVQIGIMHAATEDDIYEGYLIPKGAPVVPNIWAFTHDPDVYSTPLLFRPERFLESDGHPPERDPHTLAFGFGRRVCPGRSLADLNNFLVIARSLAVFRIQKTVQDGKEIEPIVDYQPGIVSHLSPFEVSIQPRSAEHAALIRSIEAEDLVSQGDSAVLEKLKG